MEMKEEIMGDAIDDAFEEDDEEEEGEALVNQVRAARGSERESAPPGWLSAWLCTPACLPVCLSVCLSARRSARSEPLPVTCTDSRTCSSDRQASQSVSL
jgi:hypothetical protein